MALGMHLTCLCSFLVDKYEVVETFVVVFVAAVAASTVKELSRLKYLAERDVC